MLRLNKDDYRFLVGAMGMDPAEARALDDEAVQVVYQGFLENKIMDANLLLLVLKKAKENDFSPLQVSSLLGEKNTITIKEREEILKSLKIGD